LVAASAGNHGQGIALAGKKVGAHVIVFTPEHAVKAKLDAIRTLGAELRLVPGSYSDAEQAGLDYAKSSGSTWVSPYNDGQVIAGQGSLALETIQDFTDLDRATWIVPASGGGLISGVGVALKQRPASIKPRLIGVQTEASPFMYGFFYQGTQENAIELPSLADGLAGPVEEGAVTIPLVHRYVDEMILISEEDIIQAIRYAWKSYKERIEGSAAVALAAVLTNKVTQRPAVLVISGGNIQPEIHRQIVDNNHWSI
jgi:threonine dehydratase